MAPIGERQRWVWLAASLSCIAAVTLCGLNWLWVLLGGLAACGYYYYIEAKLCTDGLGERLTKQFGFVGKILVVLMLFWLVLVMGACAAFADAAFPMVDGFPGLGWVLLAMAAWGSRKGALACAGCSGILSLFLLVLYGVIAVFAVPDVKVEYLVPNQKWDQTVTALSMFLLPAGVWCVPVRERKGKNRGMVLLLPLFAAVLSAVTAGVLSPELAEATSAPLYDVARAVSVLGVMERIEPLLSAAITMGIFCLLSALACACQMLAGQVGQWKWSGSFCCLAAGGAMFLTRALPESVLTAGNLVFFLLLPVAVTAFEKKSNFSKKGVDKENSE